MTTPPTTGKPSPPHVTPCRNSTRPSCKCAAAFWTRSETSRPTTASGLPSYPPAANFRKSTTVSTASSIRTATFLAEVKKVVEAGQDAEELYREAERWEKKFPRAAGKNWTPSSTASWKTTPRNASRHGSRHPAPGCLRTAPSEKPSRSRRHFGSHPAGGTLLLRGLPRFVNGEHCRHCQNGAPLLTHIPSRLMAGFFKKLLTKFSRGTRIRLG